MATLTAAATWQKASDRVRVRAGTTGLFTATASLYLLLLTLAWGPHWPLYALGIPAPPNGILNIGFDLGDGLFLGIVLGWGLAILCGRDRIPARPLWATGPFGAFVLACWVATPAAIDRVAATHFAMRSSGLAVLGLFVLRGLQTRRLQPAVLAALIVPGLAINGLLAIAQAIHQNPIGLTWLAEPRMLRQSAGTAVVQVQGRPILRAYGVLPHPNVLGGLLAAGLPLAGCLFARAAAYRGALPAVLRGRVFAAIDVAMLAGIGLIVAGIVLSFSRSAWLALLIGAAYLVAWRRSRQWSPVRRLLTRRAALAAAGAGVVLITLLAADRAAMAVRLQPEANVLERASVGERISLAEASLKLILWRPLTGVGGGSYAAATQRLLGPPAGDQSANLPVHNTYLLAAAELGPLGAASWLALMLAPCLSLGVAAKRRKGRLPGPRFDSSWPAVAGAGLVVVAIAGCFDFYIWVNEPVAALWTVSLAMVAAEDS
jgi:O-antigen ligase